MSTDLSKSPETRSRAGRPAKPAPADASALVEDLAADGWSIVGIAWKLGTSPKVFKRWMDESPELLEAFEIGRERERRTLHNTAFRMSQECAEPATKLRAAMYLLNTRHGYAEPRNVEVSAGNVTINLPAQRPLNDYIDGEVVK